MEREGRVPTRGEKGNERSATERARRHGFGGGVLDSRPLWMNGWLDGWMKKLTLGMKAHESLDINLSGWMDESTHPEG